MISKVLSSRRKAPYEVCDMWPLLIKVYLELGCSVSVAVISQNYICSNAFWAAFRFLL